MADYGIGLGSFVDGVARGASLAASVRDAEEERARQARRDKLEEDKFEFDRKRLGEADKRDATEHELRVRAAREQLDAQGRVRGQDQAISDSLASSRAEAKTSYDGAIAGQLHQDVLEAAPARGRGIPPELLGRPVQGPVRPGYRVGSNVGETFDTREAATTEAKRRYSFADHYSKNYAPRVAEELIAQGRTADAAAWEKFHTDRDVRRSVDMLHDAGRAAAAGQYDVALGLVQHVLNDEKYLGDGKDYGFDVVRNDAGQAIGVEGFVRDKRSGKMERQRFDSPQALFDAVIPLVAPEAVFKAGMDTIGAEKREFGKIGADEYGADEYGFIDKAAGTVTPATRTGSEGTGRPERLKTPGGFELMEVRAEDGTPVLVRPEHWQDTSRSKIAAFDPRNHSMAGFVPRSALTAPATPEAPRAPASAIPPPPPGTDPKAWRQKQTEALVKKGEPPSADEVTSLRKEVTQLPSYKNMAAAQPLYRSMLDASRRDTKAADLNLVYGLGKIMDPTSVVREGEMVMVKDTASLPDWLIGNINAVNGGARLLPETRKAIMAEARSRMSAYHGIFSADAERYHGIVSRRGMNPADVLPDIGGIEAFDAVSGAGVSRTTEGGAELVEVERDDGRRILVRRDAWDDSAKPVLPGFDPETGRRAGNLDTPRERLRMPEGDAEPSASGPPGGFSREELEAEARRRGLIR